MSEGGRTTLRDVAREANVSVMTVSNVIRGKSVKKETRERVLAVVKKLNYRPNVSARGLRQARVQSVGLVVSHPSTAFLSDPFISHIVSGLSNLLSVKDYTLDIQGVTPERFENATIFGKDGNDALCAILCGQKEVRQRHMRYLERLGVPVVVFQECFKPSKKNIAVVRQDDRGGGKQLAEYILKKKRPKEVVFLRPVTGWAAIEEREEGLRIGFQKAGLTGIEITPLVAVSEDFETVREMVASHVSLSVPDIIIAATDVMGAAAIRACEDNKLKVPKDIEVTGYNGFEVWRYTKPTLTTIMSPAYEAGVTAGKLLLEKLETGVFSKRDVKLPVTLQIGESA